MNRKIEDVLQDLDDYANDPELSTKWRSIFLKMRNDIAQGYYEMIEEIYDMREQAYRGAEFPGDYMGRWDDDDEDED